MYLVSINLKFISVTLLVLTLGACGGGSGGSSGNTGGTGGGNTPSDYYIDATSGLDSNDGRTTTTAWKTLARLASASLTFPARVYLKRGETWNEPLIFPAGNMTLDAYGSGTLPQINGSQSVSNWLDNGGGIYRAQISLGSGQGLGNLSENGAMLGFIAWDNDVSTTFSGATTGSYSFDYLLNTLYIKPAGNPLLNNYLASVELRGIYAQNLSDISISNINVSRTSLHGIEFDNCTNCQVDNVTVTRVGGAVIGNNFNPSPDFLYAGNGIDYSNSSSNGSVNNVTVSEIFDSCLAVELYKNNSTAASIQFANAQLDKCGFAGVEISVLSNQGVNTNSSINTVSVSSSTINQAGKGWSGRRYGTEGYGIRIVADNGAGSMSNISIQTTDISYSAGDGIKLAGEIDKVSLRRIRATQNDGAGVNVAAPTATSLALDIAAAIIDKNTGYGLSYNAPTAAGMSVYHTTFFDNGVINLAVFNQQGYANIQNNLFYSSAPMTHLYSAAALASPVVNNNCYNDTTNMFGYNGSAWSTVASFSAATGFETAGVGNLNVAMTSPASGDFSLTSGSACRGLGATGTGISFDYSGNPYTTPPASGALEYIP